MPSEANTTHNAEPAKDESLSGCDLESLTTPIIHSVAILSHLLGSEEAEPQGLAEAVAWLADHAHDRCEELDAALNRRPVRWDTLGRDGDRAAILAKYCPPQKPAPSGVWFDMGSKPQ
jgi:hypothetical protein